ncbi:MAG: acylphosphatase [Nitrospirota bacterium]
MMNIRVHVFISGYVHGVCFRVCTQDEARNSGIRGWVRNLRDGRVEAVFEGEQTQVEKIISWCHKGPHGASVKNVEIHYENYTDEFPSFQIS